MSNIDKRALRDAAEKATPGPWYVHDKPCEDGNYGIDTSDKEFLAEAVVWWGFSRQSIWREEDAKHIAAANPATVLALLDELEAKDRRIAEQKEVMRQAASDISYAIFNLTGSDLSRLQPGVVETTDPTDTALIAERNLRAAAAGKGEAS